MYGFKYLILLKSNTQFIIKPFVRIHPKTGVLQGEF